MKERIIAFLTALDDELTRVADRQELPLYHIGRSALVWKHGFQAATKDVDVVRPRGDRRLMDEAIRLFGAGTPRAKQYGLYLQEVSEAMPPVSGGSYGRAIEAPERWKTIRLFHLEDHDFTVTKLKRFHEGDVEDLRNLCDQGLLDPDKLKERAKAAWPFALDDGKDEDPGRERAFKNLEVVLRYLRDGIWTR